MEDLNRKSRSAGDRAETDGPEMMGPGSLLREERRNRSMDIRQVAEAIRLREHLIVAIEREKWDELPPPVFVRGFIRSYARALGLDEQPVLDLYNRVSPAQTVEPKPLLKPEKPGRGLLILLLLVMGILAGTLLYFWQGTQEPDQPSTPAGSPGPAVERSKIPPRVTDGDEAEPERRVPSAEGPYEPTDTPPGIADAPQEEPAPVPEQRPLPVVMEEFPPPPAVQEQTPSEEVPALEIEVQERTWVQISIDGREPKAFTFRPGSRPEWKEGSEFDLLIGNAGGINIVFEGKTLHNIGKSGEVVRLRLPQDLESRDRGAQ
ncbi:MAG: RodZ domain-containing protein [Thermodesulfobacteriota bacterium]